MKVNAKSSYALNILGHLILNEATEEKTISSKEIASHYGLSESYVILVARQLRIAGIIGSKKGPKGGHWILKPIDKILVEDIFLAIKDENEEENDAKQMELFVNPICDGVMKKYFEQVDGVLKQPIGEFV